MHRSSLYALLFAYVVVALTSFVYYPKWKQAHTEAIVSWDVAGYYLYLPAFLIYQDPLELSFRDTILEKYRPTPAFHEGFRHKESGHFVFKYSAGMALMYLPFFLLAHLLAPGLGFPADGYSLPYQFMLQLGSVLWCMTGLWFLRKILLEYFQDKTVALLLVLYVLGTNYLNFSAIDTAMTHNWLFTWYAILLYQTQRFYQKPVLWRALFIGFICGVCALIRPTEIISALIPLLWGIWSRADLMERLRFIRQKWPLYAGAMAVCAAVGFIQLAYWKYASGHWLVYSYEDQGFSWLKPHVKNYLFSYRTGWLVYTPMMLFAIIGLVPLFKRRLHFWAVAVFSLLNLYIVMSWDIWWFGGRAMVQSYAVWAFPFAAFLESLDTARWKKWAVYPLFAVFIYYNLWWTHQAHRGGLIDPYNMTKGYFWAVVGRFSTEPETIKLYDTSELFRGERQNVKLIYQNDFELDSTLAANPLPAINGRFSEYLNKKKQNTRECQAPLQPGAGRWLRASATIQLDIKEWDTWRMTQFVVRFMDGEKKVKEKMIRLQRLIEQGQRKELYIDVKLPQNKPFDRVVVQFWNADSDKTVLIDDLKVEVFDE